MKKRFKHIQYLLAAWVLLAACKKNYLDTAFTEGSIAEEQIWTNPDWAKGAINSAYLNIEDRYNAIDGAFLAAGSDEAVNSNPNSAVNIFNNGIWGPQRTIDDDYANMYAGIRKANLFLENAARSALLPISGTINRDSTIRRFRAEAFFLRGYYHFELVKRYGRVVLATRSFNRAEDLNLPRNTFEECVAQIVKDCDSAVLGLPTWTQDYAGASDSKELGRATKIAALALKARLLLYAASPLYNSSNDLSKWQRAADAAKAIIDLNKQSLLPQASYGNIFNYTTAAYNNEVIFAGPATNRNDIETNNAPVSYDGALGRTNPTQELVDAFEMQSTGKPITDPSSGYNADAPYSDRDPRLALAILYNGATFKGRAVQSFIGGNDGIGINVNATRTGYYLKKFMSESASWNQVSNTSVRRPWVIFRYAEVLLNYAEALNEAQGPVAGVYSAINQLRQRVSMPVLPGGLSQTDMRTRIQNERRVELCFEEHRFYDVRRWKLGDTFFNKPVTGMRLTINGNVPSYERFQVENRVFDNSKMNLFPIPQAEINKAGKLGQNPNW